MMPCLAVARHSRSLGGIACAIVMFAATLPTGASALPDIDVYLHSWIYLGDEFSEEEQFFARAGVDSEGSVRLEQAGHSSETGFHVSSATGEISLQFEHQLISDTLPEALSEAAAIFTTDQDYTYVIDGGYDPDGLWAGGLVELAMLPVDGTSDRTILFFQRQAAWFRSSNTRLSFGDEGEGYIQNEIEGAPAGVIPAGFYVKFWGLVQLQDLGSADGPPTMGEGTLRLTLIPVPEPGTGLLILAGLAGLAMKRRTPPDQVQSTRKLNSPCWPN